MIWHIYYGTLQKYFVSPFYTWHARENTLLCVQDSNHWLHLIQTIIIRKKDSNHEKMGQRIWLEKRKKENWATKEEEKKIRGKDNKGWDRELQKGK